MRLDLGILSYGQPEKLRRAIASVLQHSRCDLRIFLIDNPHPTEQGTRDVIAEAATDQRIVPVLLPQNIGYAGGVNRLLSQAKTDYIAYLDHDVEILTPGWDERLIAVMEQHAEVGWMFPGSGHYGFQQNGYHECLWSAGFCWVMRRASVQSLGELPGPGMPEWEYFDVDLGHHEEVDAMIRLRLGGWRIGCCPDVQVIHHETATRADSADHKPGGRIHDGVVAWMNKWNRYFCGDDLQYSMTAYDPRALRYTDWPPCALYLERMTLARFPEWNKAPRPVNVPGVGLMDAVEVLKPTGCYRGRAI